MIKLCSSLCTDVLFCIIAHAGDVRVEMGVTASRSLEIRMRSMSKSGLVNCSSFYCAARCTRRA